MVLRVDQLVVAVRGKLQLTEKGTQQELALALGVGIMS